MRKFVGERKMTEEEKKERIAHLQQQARLMSTIVSKIKHALALEIAAADGLQDVITYATPDMVVDADDRMYLLGKSAGLLLESVKQRGSLHGLLTDFERKMETFQYEADELEHPEKYQLYAKEEAVEKGES